jgi:hypothetical protein
MPDIIFSSKDKILSLSDRNLHIFIWEAESSKEGDSMVSVGNGYRFVLFPMADAKRMIDLLRKSIAHYESNA